MDKRYEKELEERTEVLSNRLEKCESDLMLARNQDSIWRYRITIRKPTQNLTSNVFERLYFNQPSEKDIGQLAYSLGVIESIAISCISLYDDGISWDDSLIETLTTTWDTLSENIFSNKGKREESGFKIFDHSSNVTIQNFVIVIGACLTEVSIADRILI